MSELATVGIDLAKTIFQIHGVDESGRVLVRRHFAEASCSRFSTSGRGA
ncbi:transposase [Mesorhizobium sp. Root102]|nr:transposase [Mesorhizobium sp. Root102]